MKGFFLSAATSLLVALALAVASPAQHCGTMVRARSYGAAYAYTPAYSYGYQYQTYVAPSYYNYAYTVPTYTQQDYYYQVQDFYRDSALADAAAFLALKAAGLITPALRAKEPAGSVPLYTEPEKLQKQILPVPKETPSPGKEEVVVTDVDPKLLAVVGNRCIKCHSPAVAKGGLVLTQEFLATMPIRKRWDCFDRADSGNMPKGGEPIPDSEVKLLREHARKATQMASR